MRGLPAWILGGMVVLTALLIWLGWEDRHEAGYIPFAIGIVLGLMTLASIGARMRPASDA